MKELKILSQTKTEVGKIKLPDQFNEEIRPDIIEKVFLAIQSNKRQSYGSDPEAGKKASAKLSRRRKQYKGSYGHGISRVPRKILSRRGTRFNWVGAVAPGTVGGRRAHPPKASKKWDKDINKKENKKAIRSALAASIEKSWAEKRGHIVPEGYPFIIEDKSESLEKTKQVKEMLNKLGLKQELTRSSKKIIRAGVGKRRGRKYRRKKGILIVVSKDCKIQKSAKNIPGIDIINVKKLNVEILAPGAKPGRLTLFTQSAINRLEKEKLFI